MGNTTDNGQADFEEFRAAAQAQGFDEVLERKWDAGTVVPDHSHPFDASALVVQGEMWLTVGESVQHLVPGDRFELARDVRHAERYGAQGACYWVARRSAAKV